MTPEFWLNRWQRSELGWHEDEINRHLAEHWPRLELPKGTAVLVPLCGKSLDMLWLASCGHRVLGVDISPLAAEQFFAENQLKPRIEVRGAFQYYQVDEISVMIGDFFDLRPQQVAGIAAVYDRASLIALPPDMRPRYVRHLATLLPPGVRSLLITLEYDQSRMKGPPFAVDEPEVRTLFEPNFQVETLSVFDALAESPRFRARGLDVLDERVYQLRRLPPKP
ncbi:thiopurine S-methyltransferase [Halochromatium roseum]|uniref:thiopurine S-methyltransferase n=1 Tax=Halochromatium roseum TaxID=391920 RepID=UPI001913EB48|nr:thiopurine S-methyltransferase [Halochromatium roseum]MBK5939314.1 thiopurine S-methyltransferase [Halochromatium roseum]